MPDLRHSGQARYYPRAASTIQKWRIFTIIAPSRALRFGFLH
jgi:hypothetical protein